MVRATTTMAAAADLAEMAKCTAALTMHQPWASHLVHGVKQTEGCVCGRTHPRAGARARCGRLLC